MSSDLVPVAEELKAKRVADTVVAVNGDIELAADLLNMPLSEVFSIYAKRREEMVERDPNGQRRLPLDAIDGLVVQCALYGYTPKLVFDSKGRPKGEALQPVSDAMRLKYIDLVYRLTGRYAPDKKEVDLKAEVQSSREVDLQERIALLVEEEKKEDVIDIYAVDERRADYDPLA